MRNKKGSAGMIVGNARHGIKTVMRLQRGKMVGYFLVFWLNLPCFSKGAIELQFSAVTEENEM